MEENGESEGSRKLRWRRAPRAPGCAALREEGGPEVLNEPFQTPLPMQGGKSSEAAARGHRPILPVQQDRTFNKPSPLWKRVGAPVGSTEAEVAPCRRPRHRCCRRRRRCPCVTGGDGAAATGEDAAGAQGGSSAQAPPSPAWMFSQGTKAKKKSAVYRKKKL